MRHLLLALVLMLPAALAAQESGESAAPAEPEATDADAAAAPEPTSAEPERPEGAAEAAPEAPSAADLATVPVPQPVEPVPAVTDGESTQLDELIVTAQKVKQPLRKVPLSVTALNGDFIQQTGAADLADVSLYVPNCRVDADDPGSPQVFIRGFGTNAFNPSFEASVALVQDELFLGRPGYFTEAMFDIDRVEVLRGPQGTLFGKNSVAGVFNVTSRSVDSDFALDARLFGGEDGEQRYEGGIGGMLTDWLGGRVAAMHRQQDGELFNQFQNRMEDSLEQTAGRVKAVLYPGGGLKAELTAVEAELDAPFWPFQLMRLDDDTRAYLEGFDAAIEDDPRNFVTSFNTPGYMQKGSETVGLKTEWDLDEFGPLHAFVPVLVLGTSTYYVDQLNEIDVSPADIADFDNHEDHSQDSAELRFSGSFDSLLGLGTGLDFVVGAFAYESDYTLLVHVNAGDDIGSYLQTNDFAQLAGAGGGLGQPTVPVPLSTDGDYYQFDFAQDVESTAFFGQLTWHLTEQWALTPGIRYNKEDKRADSAGIGHCPGKDAGNPLQPCFMQQLLEAMDYSFRDLRKSETDVSPKVALQWFAPHGINYYVSYARGYKSGGFNSISFGQVCEDDDNDANTPPACRTIRPEELEYEPENARTLEGGFKARSEGGRFSLNATYYTTEFDNLQVLAFNGFLFDVTNAGKAESQGWEADFQWLTPFEPLKIVGSVGMLEAYYTEYPGAPAPVHQDGSGLGTSQDLAGKTIAFAPEQTATLTPTLTLLFGDYVAALAADVLYQGGQFTDTDLDPNTYQPASTKYAARLSFAHASGRWNVALGGTNLTDERTLNQVTDAPFFPGTYFAQQAPGRALFGTLTVSF
jgi:iron complex outermembrane receptor protein